MVLDAFRIRLALMSAGILTLGFYLVGGGRLGPGNEGTIQIEHGAYPEAFEGLKVTIDGETAGTLRSVGAVTRTGFPVREGRHVVRVISSQFPCRSHVVRIESGQTVMLIMDIGESGRPGRPGRPSIVFQ